MNKPMRIGNYHIYVKHSPMRIMFAAVFVMLLLATFQHTIESYAPNLAWTKNTLDIRYLGMQVFGLWMTLEYIAWLFEIKKIKKNRGKK